MKSAPITILSLTIPAADASGNVGMVKSPTPGSSFLIVSASGLFVMQFDNGSIFQPPNGFQWNASPESFTAITFFNPSGNAIAVQFYVGQTGASFVGASETKSAATYAKGNIGLASAADVTARFGGYLSTAGQIVARGSGYKVGDILTVAGGTGTKATLLVKVVTHGGAAGEVIQVQINSPGNYSVLPTSGANSPTGGSGTGFEVDLIFGNVVTGLTYDSSGCLKVAPAANILVNNFDQSHRRKQIVFSVPQYNPGTTTANVGLEVNDVNGCSFLQLLAGQTMSLETSSQLLISSADASKSCYFIIGETYYET